MKLGEGVTSCASVESATWSTGRPVRGIFPQPTPISRRATRSECAWIRLRPLSVSCSLCRRWLPVSGHSQRRGGEDAHFGEGDATLSMRAAVGIVTLACVIATSSDGYTASGPVRIPVDVWDPPFNQQRQHVRRDYTALPRASRPWRLCASIPHLKDDYWLVVNFALIQEARRLGVRLNLFEAGGYEHLQVQMQQIAECMKAEADGLIIGAISANGLNELLEPYANRGVPVIDLINEIGPQAIVARAAADFYE